MLSTKLVLVSLTQLLAEGYKEAQQDFEQLADKTEVQQVIEVYKTLVNRNQVQSQERNIDWWRKQGWEQFKNFVTVKQNSKSQTQLKRSTQTGKAIVLDETDKWLIIIPTDKTASCFHGKNTDWCTTKPFANHFEQYVFESGVTLVYFLKLDTGTKWAMAVYAPSSYMVADAGDGIELFDQNDNSIIIAEFTQQTGLDPLKYKQQAFAHVSHPTLVGSKQAYNTSKQYIKIHSNDTEKSLEMEQALLAVCDVTSIVEYCEKFGRWKAAERIILTSGPAMLKYACGVIRGRWPECEVVLVKNKYIRMAQLYVDSIVGDPTSWPAGETLILTQIEGEDPSEYVDRIVSFAVVLSKRWMRMEQLFDNPKTANILGYGLTPDLCAEYISKCVEGTSHPLPYEFAEPALRVYPHLIQSIKLSDTNLARILATIYRTGHWVESISPQVYKILQRTKPDVAMELESKVQ